MRALKTILGSSLIHEKTSLNGRMVALTEVVGIFVRHLKRKAERVKAQEERAAANRQRREAGEDTPWQAARKERARRRAEDPIVNKRREELRAA